MNHQKRRPHRLSVPALLAALLALFLLALFVVLFCSRPLPLQEAPAAPATTGSLILSQSQEA